MKLSFSPKLIILAGLLLAGICIAISTSLAVHTPWLGIQLGVHEDGLQVTHINKNGPSFQQLGIGDVITAIATSDTQWFGFQKMDIMEDPYDLILYQEYRDFFTRQSILNEALEQNTVEFTLVDNRKITVTPGSKRLLHTLPFLFWFQLLCGGIGLLISFGVFAFRQEETSTRCFALSGIGLMFITAAAAMYSTRELAIDGNLFYTLSLVNQYGTVLLVGVGTAVLCYYPRRVSSLPMGAIFFAAYSLFALLHTLEVWDTLNIGIRLPIAIFCIINVILAIIQWRKSYQRPVSRAALKWLLYAWFSSITLFLGLRLIPTTLGYGPLIPQTAAWVVVLIIYVGIALGIIRYRLFNLDRWVLKAWFWTIGGSIVIALDFALLALLDLDTTLSAAISLAVVGWLYFPIRQLLWRRLAMGLGRSDFESLVPQILQTVLTPDIDLSVKWREFLHNAFQPMEIKPLTSPQQMAQITRNGISLQLPGLPGDSGLKLSGASHSSRLFNPNDIRFAQAVWGLFNQAYAYRHAFEQGANEERQRIARDLHDDVAARLLTLVHRSEDAGHEKLARQTLAALRDTIYALGTQDTPPLENMLADMRYEIQQRLSAIDIHLGWQVDGKLEQITLTPRQHINLQRVTQELISNVIHHTQAENVSMTFTISDQQLSLSICDDGRISNMEDWILGKGINNIKNRMNELDGSVHWQLPSDTNTGCCVELTFPIKQQS